MQTPLLSVLPAATETRTRKHGNPRPHDPLSTRPLRDVTATHGIAPRAASVVPTSAAHMIIRQPHVHTQDSQRPLHCRFSRTALPPEATATHRTSNRPRLCCNAAICTAKLLAAAATASFIFCMMATNRACTLASTAAVCCFLPALLLPGRDLASAGRHTPSEGPSPHGFRRIARAWLSPAETRSGNHVPLYDLMTRYLADHVTTMILRMADYFLSVTRTGPARINPNIRMADELIFDRRPNPHAPDYLIWADHGSNMRPGARDDPNTYQHAVDYPPEVYYLHYVRDPLRRYD